MGKKNRAGLYDELRKATAEYMKKNGLSLTQLAAGLGVTEQAVRKFVNGPAVPRPETVERIWNILQGDGIVSSSIFDYKFKD